MERNQPFDIMFALFVLGNSEKTLCSVIHQTLEKTPVNFTACYPTKSIISAVCSLLLFKKPQSPHMEERKDVDRAD